MPRSLLQLRDDALRIWQAGVDGVRSERLVREHLRVQGRTLFVGLEEDAESIDLDDIERIAVVGAGKAGAGMAASVEEVLGPKLWAEKQLAGWVNVPEDCVRPLVRIHLHGARPAGVNEPTEAGVAGTAKILELVASLGPRDLCLCLISGGGSALLPAPADGVTLADKLAVTQFLSAAGANILQLNTVRKPLSRIKGGGLARACRAGKLISLIISDVPGDPLGLIASGPTVAGEGSTAEALSVLESFGAREAGIPAAIFAALERPAIHSPPQCEVVNLIIGNNATAVDAAGIEAERLGYSHAMISARVAEGPAEDVGEHLATMALRMQAQPGPDCLISGGEPTVRLVEPARRGRGGRNQQLALAALLKLSQASSGDETGVVILSGGTDGEDGPTDAAGAWIDNETASIAAKQVLRPAEFLDRNDAYHFFEQVGGLIKTGPTHTNVGDLRVVVVDRVEHEAALPMHR